MAVLKTLSANKLLVFLTVLWPFFLDYLPTTQRMYTTFPPRVLTISECLPFNLSGKVKGFLLCRNTSYYKKLKFSDSVRYRLGDVSLLKVDLQITGNREPLNL